MYSTFHFTPGNGAAPCCFLPCSSRAGNSRAPLPVHRWREPVGSGLTNRTAVCELRKVFTLNAAPTNALVFITADNGYELYVNGSLVGSDIGVGSDVWQSVERYDVTSRLVKGRNIIGIHGLDLGGVRAVIAAVRVEGKSDPPLELVTDGTWRVAREGAGVDYSHPEFVEGPDWREAKVVGPMGMAPWGRVAWSEASERARAKSLAARLELAKPGGDFEWPEAVAFLGDDCSVYSRRCAAMPGAWPSVSVTGRGPTPNLIYRAPRRLDANSTH